MPISGKFRDGHRFQRTNFFANKGCRWEKEDERWQRKWIVQRNEKFIGFFKANEKNNDLKSFEETWKTIGFYYTNEFSKRTNFFEQIFEKQSFCF